MSKKFVTSLFGIKRVANSGLNTLTDKALENGKCGEKNIKNYGIHLVKLFFDNNPFEICIKY